MLFVTSSTQLTQRMPCQGSSWKCFGNFAIGKRVIRTVKYADDLVLLPTGHYWQINWNWKILRNENGRGKILGNEGLQTAIHTTDYERSKTTGEYGVISTAWVVW